MPIPDITKAELPCEDLASIEVTLNRYARATDEVDYDALASTFTPDAVLTMARGGVPIHDPIKGRDAITTYFINSRKAQGWPERHFITNIVAKRTPEGAEVHAYCVVTRIDASGGVSVWLTGSYTNQFVRTDEGVWLIASEHIVSDTGLAWPSGAK